MSDKLPNQPKYRDEDGRVRFVPNRIVRYLLDNGGIDLNQIAWLAHCANAFTQEEQEQFAQLIGYSLSGYADLSYVSDEKWEEVNTGELSI